MLTTYKKYYIPLTLMAFLVSGSSYSMEDLTDNTHKQNTTTQVMTQKPKSDRFISRHKYKIIAGVGLVALAIGGLKVLKLQRKLMSLPSDTEKNDPDNQWIDDAKGNSKLPIGDISKELKNLEQMPIKNEELPQMPETLYTEITRYATKDREKSIEDSIAAGHHSGPTLGPIKYFIQLQEKLDETRFVEILQASQEQLLQKALTKPEALTSRTFGKRFEEILFNNVKNELGQESPATNPRDYNYFQWDKGGKSKPLASLYSYYTYRIRKQDLEARRILNLLKPSLLLENILSIIP